MSKIFVDTSGWANFFDTDEPFHGQARSIYENARNIGTRLVTTNYVIAELVSLLTSPFCISRPRIIEYIEGIKQSSAVELIHIDEGLDNRAWNLFTERDDKKMESCGLLQLYCHAGKRHQRSSHVRPQL